MGLTPEIVDFSPNEIPFQRDLLTKVRREVDYSLGCHEFLLSGSIGSAKSLVAAHIAVTHCLMFPNARVGLGRLSMPALKGTIFRTIVEHIGEHIEVRTIDNQAIIHFPNGSEIRSFSWSDKKYKKVRSFEFTAFLIEELTENDTEDMYLEIYGRLGRLQNQIPECWIISCTNPDDPSHWAYKRFFETNLPTRHVLMSKTEDNPYLPKTYIETLKESYDAKMARRMLYGEWISISQDVIYYSYEPDVNYVDRTYKILKGIPVYISFDFNIGHGKPMSCVLGQFDNGIAHWFDEVIIEGARTLDIMEELNARGYFRTNYMFYICGDASGSHRDTRGARTDYDIIYGYLDNLKTDIGTRVRYLRKVPRSNPPVRLRHNLVNSYCKNSLGHRRLFVYNKCNTLNQGLKLTKLKQGSSFVEDDSKPYQHVTTALGYALFQMDRSIKKQSIMETDRWN